MKAETLKALSKCLVRKVPEEVTCVLHWEGGRSEGHWRKNFPSRGKARAAAGRQSPPLGAGGQWERPSALGFSSAGREQRPSRQASGNISKAAGIPQGHAPFPQPPGPQLPCSDQMAGAWEQCVPVAHHLLSNPSFPVCGEIELVFLSPPGVSFSEAPFALRWKGMVWVEQTQLSGGNAVQSLLQKEELRPQPGGFWPWLGCSH